MQKVIRQYVMDLLSTHLLFGEEAAKDYQRYISLGAEEATSHVIVGFCGKMWAANQNPTVDEPYRQIRVNIHDNAYPEEEFVSLELNTIMADEIAEVFYFKINFNASPSDDYECELRNSDNFQQTQIFTIKTIDEIRDILQEFSNAVEEI